MKKLSLLEFRDYCNSLSASTFIFSTDNQQWRGVDDNVSMDLVFHKMIITFSPNTIFFKDHRNSLRLDKVKAIKMRDSQCPLGEIFTVVCGDLIGQTHDKEYTLVAQ